MNLYRDIDIEAGTPQPAGTEELYLEKL